MFCCQIYLYMTLVTFHVFVLFFVWFDLIWCVQVIQFLHFLDDSYSVYGSSILCSISDAVWCPLVSCPTLPQLGVIFSLRPYRCRWWFDFNFSSKLSPTETLGIETVFTGNQYFLVAAHTQHNTHIHKFRNYVSLNCKYK